MRWNAPLLAILAAMAAGAHAATRVQAAPVPPEMRSTAFTVIVNKTPVDVAHAAASYEFASFDITGPVDILITAEQPGFWDRGVDIQPWRLGIRPTRSGQTIRFRLSGPVKLSISRPGDFLNHAKMLFLFAGTPPPTPPTGANVRVVAPGVYRESLNPKSGDTLYLAPGSYFFGSLNLWKVENVRVLGRGTIVYEGGQDPENDEGWMQRPDWHCVGALEAHKIEIDGLTCVVRARTWSIQMKDSTGFVYDDLRVIGGNPGNANQDGMDWLGGGDTIVRNAFLRASDDVFAMQGNWDGYNDEDMVRPGHDVKNILIEKSELSTSISNIVRLDWPRKHFNSSGFTLRDSDILHGGIGACGQEFGVLGLWGANGASGEHDDLTFENLFLDNWYTLLQVEQEEPQVKGIVFRNIWALDQPALTGSTIRGAVKEVTLENVKMGQARATNDGDVPLTVTDGAEPVKYLGGRGPAAEFTMDPPVFAPGERVTFAAKVQPGTRYTWFFGDGSEAHGRQVVHRFPDAEGTELDSSGRFRVLLKAENSQGNTDWAAQSVVVVAQWHDALAGAAPTEAGLNWLVYPGTWSDLPDLSQEQAIFGGQSPGLQADAQGFTKYAVVWDGFVDIPADGGYTFYLLARDGARLTIDGIQVARTGPPFAQVCEARGNAVRFDRGSLGLRAGLHRLHVEDLHTASGGAPRLLWEGPALPLKDVPTAAFRRVQRDAVTREAK